MITSRVIKKDLKLFVSFGTITVEEGVSHTMVLVLFIAYQG